MDYTSFAPGNKSAPATAKPNLSTPEFPLPRKHFNHQFIGVVLIIAALALAAFYGVWYWQNNQPTQNLVPTHTSRPAQLQYRNNQYGFYINLPDSWKGYSVLNRQWEGRDVSTGNVVAHGLIITLRHPLWTVQNPREDMPIMIFTPAQWQQILKEQLAVSAAPIPPSMLSQNSSYILALPARYNYDFKTGWQEVDQIVRTLKSFEPIQ